MISMNRLTIKKRVQVIAALVEGNSIRSTARMTGFSKNTIIKLLRDVGRVCDQYQSKVMVNLSCKRGWATAFLRDLAKRLKHRGQLTSDGHKGYLSAVEDAFGGEIDYATLVKTYGKERRQEQKYSPTPMVGCKLAVINGNPDVRDISTSYVERQNLTMRMSMRRFTRLTNGFSKKVENLHWAVALHFMHYNFCRIHTSLKVTPAMEAGVSDHLWSIEDVVELLENKEKSK